MTDQNALALQGTQEDYALVANVLARGDVSGLNPEQLTRYYVARCHAMGLDPRAQPFDIVTFQGKRVLYPNKGCAEQLRQIHGISLGEPVVEQTPDGLRIVTITATDRQGRTDVEVAALSVKGLTGEALANAYMKVITKAKRRVTLSICGLGGLPELDDEDARKAGLRRIHATAAERGMDHDEVRAFAQQHYPAIASMTELDSEELTVLSDALQSELEAENDAALIEVDPETGEIIGMATDDPVAVWRPLIESASNLDELQAVATGMKEAGVHSEEHPELLRLFRARLNLLKIEAAKTNRAAQEQRERAAASAA